LLITFVLSPFLALGFPAEAKRPFALEEKLRIHQGPTAQAVSGQTFSYASRGDNGLIGEVQVLGRDIGGGVPIPNLAVAGRFDPEVLFRQPRILDPELLQVCPVP
jgi:hypothetical protein